MKTKFLLLIVIVTALGVMFTHAQDIKVLIDEDFSTQKWFDELVKFNPEYTTPAGPSGSKSDINSGPYFDTYLLYSGAIEVIGEPATGLCGDESTVHKFDDVAVSWRLKNPSTGISYIELPKLPSVGRVTIHIKSGGTGGYFTIKNSDDDTILSEKSLTNPNNDHFKTHVCQTVDNWVGIRDSVKLRIAQSTMGTPRFIKILAFKVEEHPATPLKSLIDSALVVLDENAENIGESPGNYPQEAYDEFGNAIETAQTLYDSDDPSNKRAQFVTGINNIKAAFTNFYESMVDIIDAVHGYNLTSISILQNDRTILLTLPANIAIYNAVGMLICDGTGVSSMEIPASVPAGVYLVKTPYKVQKIILK